MFQTSKVTIFTTDNYDKLKPLLGNRDVTERRVNNIMESIQRIGYISQPIIVNEKLEVIDGQGRLEALKRLGKPIEYRVIPGLTVKQCHALNLKNGGWSVGDFVKSYAAIGDRNYANLMALHKKYGLPYSTLLTIAAGRHLNGHAINALRDNNLMVSAEQIQRLDEVCSWLMDLKPVHKEIGGNQQTFYTGLAFVYNLPGVDRDRLKYAIQQYKKLISPYFKTKLFLEDVSKAYNKCLAKSKKRNFAFEWETKEIKNGK